MPNEQKLTELEQKFIAAYEGADEFDEKPCMCFEDLCDHTGLSPKIARGVLSSLLQKGIISEGEYPNGLAAYYLENQ
jgi:hypothetical protein